jgi:hypothetical protein
VLTASRISREMAAQPLGPLGDFWKKHPDGRALAAEAAVLEGLTNDRFWGRRRTRR